MAVPATATAGMADEPDAWNARIAATGCEAENTAVLLCYADERDWRRCAKQVKAFKDCFDAHTRAKDRSDRTSTTAQN